MRSATPTTARRDGGAAYGHRLARILGPIDARPRLDRCGVEGLSCDPGTGGGQCPRVALKTHRRAPPAPWGWEAQEAGREADRAWWGALGARLGGDPLPELDVDSALGGRGAWELAQIAAGGG